MSRVFLTSIIFFALLCFPRALEAAILAPAQSQWLEKHNNTLLVRPEKNYPPFSFSSSIPNSTPKGLAVDYLDLVARKLSARPTYLEAKSLSSILADMKSGKEGIVLALPESDSYGEYLYFSEPFVSIPAVIVTRKDYAHGNGELTLTDFNAKQVAVVDGYAVQGYIEGNYQKIILDLVSDDEVALQKLLLGEVDAAVMDLASLSYYTSHDMLSYVTVAGQTGFEYKLAFAVPKTMPDLVTILNAGLKEITPSERNIIKDRWITFPSRELQKNKGFLSLSAPLWVGISIVGVLIITILLIIIIVHNRRHHGYHIASLSRAREKEKELSKLSDELKDLEAANSVLDENMQEIKTLEKNIQEKIEHIHD